MSLASDLALIGKACLIGAVAGSCAFLLDKGVDLVGTWRVHLSHQNGALLVLPLYGALGGLIAGFLVQRFAPEAAGSGIPQVKAVLERVPVPMLFSTVLVKVFGGIVALGSGLFMGREGPTVHAGAALAAQLERFIPSGAERARILLATGAGAGLAAAFNAPLAGVIFVVEELLKEISAPIVASSVLACFTAAVSADLLGTRRVSDIVHVSPQSTFAAFDIPVLLVLAIACGIAGSFFNRAVLSSLSIQRDKLKIPTCLKVAVAGAVTGIIIALLPPDFHDYAHMRQVIVSGHNDWVHVSLGLGAIFVLTAWAYGAGAPGGLFAPSLAMGAGLGFLCGAVQKAIAGGGSPELLALAGMGAMFAAVARVPVTAIVILFEMTADFGLLLPLMMVCIVSTYVGEKLYSGSIYERLMEWGGMLPPKTEAVADTSPEPEPIAVLKGLEAKDVMKHPVETIAAGTLLPQVLARFVESRHRGFPVVDGDTVIGIVTPGDVERKTTSDDFVTLKVEQAMTDQVITVTSQTALSHVLYLFNHHRFSRLPVIDDGRLVGIVTRSDVLESIYHQLSQAVDASAGSQQGCQG